MLALLTAATAAAKPNIMLVVADDLGFNDVGWQTPSYTHTLTPNLDKLAKAGAVLHNHHVQPFCSPTRACLMTGRHVLRYGLQNTVIWPQDAWAVPQNETLLSENLKAAGYYTAYYGKWHLGLYKDWALPLSRGYDEQYGYYLGGEDYWTHSRNGGIDWHRNDTLCTDENGTYSADLLGAATVDFVHRMKRLENPWFLYLPWQSVHSPLEAKDEDLKMYPNLTGNVRTRSAMITAMDTNMGNIVAALEETKQLENTVIVFTSDNGAPFGAALYDGDAPEFLDFDMNDPTKNTKPRPPAPSQGPNKRCGGGGGSNYPLTGWKHYVFEGGVRSASFIYNAPGVAKGSVHHGLFHAVDWLPTLAKMGGAKTNSNLPLDGLNILPALQAGGRTSPHDELPIQITACGKGEPGSIVDGPAAAMIVGDMKVIVECYWRTSKNTTTAQLYNITEDAAEENDLSAKMPDVLEKVIKRLDYWEQQSVDPYNKHSIDKSCGGGKPQGTPKHWDKWC